MRGEMDPQIAAQEYEANLDLLAGKAANGFIDTT